MFVVTGITGNVGGELARTLLAQGKPVRGVVRHLAEAAAWTRAGADLVVSEITDATALEAAFRGAAGVFLLAPPCSDPDPGFPEAHRLASTLLAALDRARPERVVYLSSVGAHACEENLLSQHTILERALRTLSLPITFLRPAWFLENALADIPAARETGSFSSFLQPLDRAIPMVATADTGRLAANLLQDVWGGHRIVELEGPSPVSPLDLAATLCDLLGLRVTADAVPHIAWEALFRSQGMRNPAPRMRMLDGFNEGWIHFESTPRKGTTDLRTVLTHLLEA